MHHPDAVTALREIRRVLTPAGTLHFVEHGLAPEDDEQVRRLQRRLEPLQKRLLGGCHLTRQIVEMLTTAGFTVTGLDVFSQEGAPRRCEGAASLGLARPAGTATGAG